MHRRFDGDLSVWPFQAALALLQIPVFFLYFQTDPSTPFFYAVCLSCLLCLCCLYKATGFLGPLFFAVFYLKPYLLVYYNTVYAGILLSLLYWTLIWITYPEASFDRLVLFLLACLGSRLSSPIVHDHCATLALTTMTVSLTESLVDFREWLGRTIEAIVARGWYQRRLLAKVRVLMIILLVAVLLRTSIMPQEANRAAGMFRNVRTSAGENTTNGMDGFRLALTAREFLALLMTLLIAVHLVAREVCLLGFQFYGRYKTTAVTVTAPTKVDGHMGSPVSVVEELDHDLDKVISGKISLRQLEKNCKNASGKVKLRRAYLERRLSRPLELSSLCDPTKDEEAAQFYECVEGTCCENVIGFVTIPLGFVGPLEVNGTQYFVPMATTEGALVASTARGCKLLSSVAGGVRAHVVSDQMTRGPVFETSSLDASICLRNYIGSPAGFDKIKEQFESTSRFARLRSIHAAIGPSTRVFVRFSATTGDAMGMNMLSKATEKAAEHIVNKMRKTLDKSEFVRLLALSGNFCVDKKSSASNWLNGRGKSVIAEVHIPQKLVRQHFKVSSAEDLVRVNVNKNLLGASMSASQPGASCNAQAANIVAAIFAACGQDLGQVGTSAACMTWIEINRSGMLHVSVTMPCIEVGTVGGGTGLPIQEACLKQLGVKGSSLTEPGKNAKTFACIIAATVMAAELSLLAALCTNDLVRAHMALNRTNEQKPTL